MVFKPTPRLAKCEVVSASALFSCHLSRTPGSETEEKKKWRAWDSAFWPLSSASFRAWSSMWKPRKIDRSRKCSKTHNNRTPDIHLSIYLSIAQVPCVPCGSPCGKTKTQTFCSCLHSPKLSLFSAISFFKLAISASNRALLATPCSIDTRSCAILASASFSAASLSLLFSLHQQACDLRDFLRVFVWFVRHHSSESLELIVCRPHLFFPPSPRVALVTP